MTWLTTLNEVQRQQVLGEFWREILAYTRAAAGEADSPDPPPALDPKLYRDSLDRFGRNGPSVALFLESWKSIPWRAHETEPHAKDHEVIRVGDYTGALNPTASPRWKEALQRAGYRSSQSLLNNVWEAASVVGHEVGGHHAAFLAAAASSELAQMPKTDDHFFLAMMPWIRAGFWPCGWDDNSARLEVL